ncbi:MAG: hypothetical protein JWR80_8924 [Bradyrhizobium sp.]|nr:hypothetical protein [Bradyrhizobium sp.]
MFIIMIRRFVRPDREAEFLAAYDADKSTNPDFQGETLTRLSGDEAIPDVMATLFKPVPDCVTYVNIARWTNWRSFVGQCEMPPDSFNAEIEVAPRQRAVLEVVEEVEPTSGN